MSERITDSEKNTHGEITVFFGNGNTNNSYYAHGITNIGDEHDNPSHMTTMWAWINHMRAKNWFSPSLEEAFIREVKKHL